MPLVGDLRLPIAFAVCSDGMRREQENGIGTPPPTKYAVTVTAKSGALLQTTQLAMTIQ
jgi:hypothetical protein